MPKQSRLRRFGMWLSTIFRSVGALFFPANIKNALTQVTKNWKEYICFYLAALAVCAGFWTVALCTESNLRDARNRVEENFDYHVEVIVPNEQAYVDMDAVLRYELARENEYLKSFYWAYDEQPLSDGSYVVRLSLKEPRGLETSFIWVKARILDKQVYTDTRFSPQYAFEEDFGHPYNTQLWTVSLIWFAFSVLILLLLFLIRLDHFRFIYGVYMTFGADFPRLMGAAGGELAVIALLCYIPAGLIGVGIAAALYVPAGVGLTVTLRAALMSLLGILLASFCAVWLPMRRLSKQPPIRHLTAADNTSLVSSPRRSFHLFGSGFPGKYELYGLWRMRKYYARLLISAVLFASVFVSGLYVAEHLERHHQTDPSEYILRYGNTAGVEKPDESEEEGDESPAPTLDREEAELVWGDLSVILPELEAIPGISHATWSASVSGGYTSSHLLLQNAQVLSSGNAVISEERASEGHKWAINNYEYTAVDRLWIDNMINHGLCTFEGDPYAVLTGERKVIISEEIFNGRHYRFRPGDKIIVAVCEEVHYTEPMPDAGELLRGQIRENKFRYETYTVAAVMRGASSRNRITFGVSVDRYRELTDEEPCRDEIVVYMENGTDMATVRAAELAIRKGILGISGWTVTPTGNYFKAQVRSLKNDDAVVLTLAVCLLCISPMIWYFSQIMFYRKRRREFALLRALGAPEPAFSRMHRLMGGLLSGAAFLITALLSLLGNGLIYFFVNTLLPRFSDSEGIRESFSFSLPALLACAAVSLLCGFLSCEIPYRIFARRDRSKDTDEL